MPATVPQNSGTVGAVILNDPPGLEKDIFAKTRKATTPLPKASTGTLASKALVATLVASTFAFGESCFASVATLGTHANFDNANNFHVDRTTFEALPENAFHFNYT